MAAGIASGFVRKLYRILDQESDAVIGWDPSGTSFSIYDSTKLNELVLPRYFRGRLSAFRQQLVDHGFERIECEDDENREAYCHPDFLRGCPGRLNAIVRNPKPKRKGNAGNNSARKPMRKVGAVTAVDTAMGELRLVQPSPTGSGPLSVHIGGGGCAKRASPTNMQMNLCEKRICTDNVNGMGMVNAVGNAATTAQLQVPAASADGQGFGMSSNPLFSNDPTMDVDVARVFSLSRMSENGLLPPSTDLPEPISYLSNASMMATAAGTRTSAPPAVAGMTTTSAPLPLANMDDMMTTMLEYFVSASTTNVPNEPVLTQGQFIRELRAKDSIEFHGDTMSTSEFLSLVASSVTGAGGNGIGGEVLSLSTASATGLSAWATPVNPLFSDKLSSEEEDEDSVMSLLVEASVDRVKTGMAQLTTPQDRMKLIMEERERLEEQRRKLTTSGNEVSNVPAASLFAQAQNSTLKRRASGELSTDQPPRKSQMVAPVAPGVSAEDSMLWLLMSSTSVDWLNKKANEFDV